MCIWGCMSNEISLAQTTLTIAVVYIRGRMLGSDLTQWPPNQILSVHRTGRPLEPQVHWDATGTTLADASTQWCSSGDPVLICIIGTHWKTTGATSTLGCHWNHTGGCLHPVVFQWRSSVNLHNWNTLEDHWKATGKPLEDHWKHTGISPVAFQCTLGPKFQAHWIATGLPLEDHWLRVRDASAVGTNVRCYAIKKDSADIFRQILLSFWRLWICCHGSD